MGVNDVDLNQCVIHVFSGKVSPLFYARTNNLEEMKNYFISLGLKEL
jgi:hypothetical protein